MARKKGKKRGEATSYASVRFDVTPTAPTPPAASNKNVRRSMQGNKRSNTKPELIVRRMLREMGFPGYRLQWKKAPGHPDIAYPGRKIAIFVHGCFWHRCPVCNLPMPRSHVEFWETKFIRNVERDRSNRKALEDDGWTVAVIWEHQLKTPQQLSWTEEYLFSILRSG